MEQIRNFFQRKYIAIPEKDWSLITPKFVREEYPKKTLILKSGEVENYVSFIEKGIVRYYLPKENNEITFELTFADNFMGAYDSFLTRLPSLYHIETLTPASLLRISYDDLQCLYLETASGNHIGRLAAEALFLEKSKRELSLLRDSAEERYLRLFKEQPYLIKEIPLRYIASYIGVTPQALSRIRKRIS